MPRYNRINLDGKSITETRTSAADVLPGQLMQITAGKFVVPTADAKQQLFVANVAHLQGLDAATAIPSGDSIEGEYLETGREVAALVSPTLVLVKGSPLSVAATGYLIAPTDITVGTGTVKSPIVAYAQEALTVGAAAELVLVRGA